MGNFILLAVYSIFEASADILQSSHAECAGDALQLLPILATYGLSQLPLPLAEAGWKGALYIAIGQVKHALLQLELVVTIHEKKLAEDHPDCLAAQYALAEVYQANG